MSQRNLAQYFEHTDDAKRTKDKWLSDYFYDACLKTGSMVKISVENSIIYNNSVLPIRCMVITDAKKVKPTAMLDLLWRTEVQWIKHY